MNYFFLFGFFACANAALGTTIAATSKRTSGIRVNLGFMGVSLLPVNLLFDSVPKVILLVEDLRPIVFHADDDPAVRDPLVPAARAV